MALQDKTLTCRDCGQAFIFTVSEQELFAQRGFTNEPRRCSTCRATRRASEGGETGGGMSTGPRQMYPAVCANCGKATQVPFQPRGDRPVYCSDCFSRMGGGTRRR
ncbi:MAG: zinc-binding protein [Dehalococcoidia bacterium]|nr:zinc-binding protein [Dehalococcoidia bacterium]